MFLELQSFNLIFIIKKGEILIITKQSSFEQLRDYGVPIINYAPTYITMNDIKDWFIPEPDCDNMQDYKNSLEYINKHIKGLNISFPKKLIPIQHPDDYDIIKNLSDEKFETFESDKLFNIYDYEQFETYADMSNNMLSYFMDQYLLCLSICKEYNIKNIVDIGCNCGIQSYLFNLNNINYKGVDAFKLNVFPFVLNRKSKVCFIHALYPDEYTEDCDSNNTMLISFNAYYPLNSDSEEEYVNASNKEFIRLINDYKYIFLTIYSFYPYLYNIPIIKERIDKIITFENSYAMKEEYDIFGINDNSTNSTSNDLIKDGYVLLIRKGGD